jgi:replicative DNA helicase
LSVKSFIKNIGTGRAFDIVSEILPREGFYVEANQLVFGAMQMLAQKNMPIDMLTVSEELRFREELDLIGGPFYLTQLTKDVFSSANIETHCRIVLQKFIQREVIRVGGEMIHEAYEESADVFELLDTVESNVFGLTLNYLKNDYKHIASGLSKVMERIEHLKTLDETITGIPAGYESLDNITHGWQNSDLIILAARPSVGKTSFSLNLARNAALHPKKPTAVGFFSLEMSMEQLIARILSAESNIWLKSIKTGRLDDSQTKTLYEKGVNRLSQAPIYIDDTAALNMFELRAKARRMVNKHHVGLIIIDYLQLMSGSDKKNTNREQEISKISRDLKGLAKNLKVPIIALSQLSREVEKRGKGQKMPQLSDLRESGAIEQDADMVMFLYRPPQDEVKEDIELANKGLLNIAKHRDGELGEIVFDVDNSVQVWKEKQADPFSPLPSNWKKVSDLPAAKNYYEPDDGEDAPF